MPATVIRADIFAGISQWEQKNLLLQKLGGCNKFSQKMNKKKDIKLTKYFLNEIFCEISQIRDILSEHEKDK